MDEVAETIDEVSVPLSVRLRRATAVSMLLLAWAVLGTVLVASVMRVERWEVAPGEAMKVAPRIEFVGSGGELPVRYAAGNTIRFVTAFTGQLTALDAFVGWLDPDVQVDTYVEHFGESDPNAVKQAGVQAMYSAQQLALYVALTRLGIGNPSFEEGPAVVARLVCEGTPTDDSACRTLAVGDTITAFDGTATPTPSALRPLLEGRAPGDLATVTVRSAGSDATVDRRIRLIGSETEPGRVLIGVVLADTRSVVLPFDVAISTGGIGGPSAGLAFTLALLDELTPGELFGDVAVAATGTIDENGDVGAIGALPQKAVAVMQAGAEVFLVPAGQSDEEVARAETAAHGRVRLIKVANLDDALRILVDLGGDPLPTRS